MIFFCYGIPKSASSFVFQMTRGAAKSLDRTGRVKLLRLADLLVGCPPTPFAETALKKGLGIDEPLQSSRRALYLDPLFERLLETMDRQSNEAVVIKTHLPCTRA